MPSNSIILSILIPAYHHGSGVIRILDAASEDDDTLEIIIYDDSKNSDVRRAVEPYRARYPNITYQNNLEVCGQSLGAVENWNALLDAARGEYVILMHHDEFPCNGGILKTVSEVVTNNPGADVFLLGLSILDQRGKKKAMHAPYWFRYLIGTRFPGYLFRRNVIGPTGTLIIRRKVLTRFYSDLIWLVDVEFYYRLFTSGVKIRKCPQVIIGSVQGAHRSVTALLKSNIAEIERDELSKLTRRYPHGSLWLSPAVNWIIRSLEGVFWLSWRVLSKAHCYAVDVLGHIREK